MYFDKYGGFAMSNDHHGVARRGAVLLVAAGALITAAGCSPANDASTPPETHVTWPASDDSAVTFAIERWAVDSRSPTEYVVTGRREKAGDDALRVILSRSSAGSIHARFEQPERAELVIGVDGRVDGEASILARAALSQGFADLATATEPQAAATAGLATRTALITEKAALLSSQCLSEDAANALGTAAQCMGEAAAGSGPSEACSSLAGAGAGKGVCVASLYNLVGKIKRVNTECVFAAVAGAAINQANFETATLACGWTIGSGILPTLACGYAVGDIVEKTFKLKATCKVAFNADQNSCAKAACDPVGTIIETTVSKLDTKPASVAGEKCVVEDKCDDKGNGAITCYQLTSRGKVTSTRYRKC